MIDNTGLSWSESNFAWLDTPTQQSVTKSHPWTIPHRMNRCRAHYPIKKSPRSTRRQ